MKRLRILLSAYYFSPYRGGESAVGWKVANELIKYHDVTVLCGDLSPNGTTGSHLREFEKEQSYPEGLKVHYVLADEKTQRIHDFHSKPGMWFLYYTAYKRWQMQAYEEVKKLHASEPYDIVHQLNIVSHREPGYLWRLNTPFVWGPISGASMTPVSFLSSLSMRGKCRNGVRNVMNWLQMRTAWRSRQAAKKAAKIWVVSRDDHDLVEGIWRKPAEYMLEVGTEKTEFKGLHTLTEGRPIKLCWSGLLEARKALPILLHALSKMRGGNWELYVLGDGPERSSWKKQSSNLGIDGKVIWKGMLPRDKALQCMNNSDLFVHTSVREATGTVNLEAMSMGLPVICHDACGMGIAINENCGIKVPLKNPETSIEGFKAAIQRLLDNPALLSKLSEGALARAKELSWDKKVKRIAQTYLDVVDCQKAPLK